MSDDLVVVNGIDAVTGQYLIPPIEVAELASRLRAAPGDGALAARLSASLQNEADPHLGLPFTVHPEVVAEAGWGILFHKDEAQDVRDALEPLVEHRRTLIKNDKVVKQLQDFKPGDDVPGFLARHGVGQGSVVPTKVPYYVLIVGSPERIPFEFGHQLDVEYCVGRLHFDTAAEYSAYVKSVIDYETGTKVPNAREAVFWSPRHPLDSPTQLSADQLVKPLVDGVPAAGTEPPEAPVVSLANFRSRKFWGGDAKKQALRDVFMPGTGPQPAFLFTASHGVGFAKDDPRQRDAQGALLCQDWGTFKPIEAAHYFAASDVPDDARVHGLVSFHFACFGAGTPTRDQFVHKAGEVPPDIAAAPFMARLPQRLLSHPNGGALACIGHVERAWGCSIVTARAGAQLLPFRNCIGRILAGQPVGFAVKDFNERYASLTVTLAGLLQQAGFGVKVPDAVLASRWLERNDAEGYVVLGDPAVSLRVNDLV